MTFAACCRCAMLAKKPRRWINGCLLSLAAFGAGSGGGAASGQGTLYVDDNAPAGGDGLSWATAFQHPQQALDLASSAPGPGYVVRIAQLAVVTAWGACP